VVAVLALPETRGKALGEGALSGTKSPRPIPDIR
jgi:hypothetical protein